MFEPKASRVVLSFASMSSRNCCDVVGHLAEIGGWGTLLVRPHFVMVAYEN